MLRGFEKVTLRPGETRTVAFSVSPQDLAYYDATAQSWQVEPVGYTAHIGANSEDAVTRTVRFELNQAAYS
ncbi:fibronectin type III-like domain-contianing protein [uncultured Hyphomonas sp.]|uniref:fibronectin type III-like domain-contianing protein n=1 Tax=uncultured Hyphomonas sp. TaxID=225298 RepID=UPI00344C1B76